MSITRALPISLAATVGFLCVVAGQPGSVTAQQSSYRLVEHWPQLADDFEWGQLPNLTIDHDGNIYGSIRVSQRQLADANDLIFARKHGLHSFC